jgi:hypothetical protein
VGTPPVTWTRSRSMIVIASTGSQRRMKMVVLPVAIEPIRLALQAVTWKSGITISPTFGVGSGTGSPRRSAARAMT